MGEGGGGRLPEGISGAGAFCLGEILPLPNEDSFKGFSRHQMFWREAAKSLRNKRILLTLGLKEETLLVLGHV